METPRRDRFLQRQQKGLSKIVFDPDSQSLRAQNTGPITMEKIYELKEETLLADDNSPTQLSRGASNQGFWSPNLILQMKDTLTSARAMTVRTAQESNSSSQKALSKE
jgi:hypothetical protein